MNKKTIALDFDGVLHDYHGWNNGVLNGPISGAREAVETLQDQFTTVIFTTREATTVRAWLKEHEFPPLEVTREKPLCIVLVDDRALRFQGVWTPQVIAEIVGFRTHWEDPLGDR